MLRLTRRDMVRGVALAVAGAALTTPAAASAHTASRPPDPQGTGRGGAGTTHMPRARTGGTPEPFDEMYLGRHIEGWPAEEHGDGHHPGSKARNLEDSMGFVVRIDDADLHVMQNADGTWISVVNHYETHRTPRDAARAAVRELRGASLVPLTV